MSYGRIRQCLISDMCKILRNTEKILRAPLMLHFALSYVILLPSIALRLQRCFSFHLYFPTPTMPVRFDKRHIQAQAERLLTLCSALGQIHSMVLPLRFLLASLLTCSQSLPTLGHGCTSSILSHLRQYCLHPSHLIPNTVLSNPPPFVRDLALSRIRSHRHPSP